MKRVMAIRIPNTVGEFEINIPWGVEVLTTHVFDKFFTLYILADPDKGLHPVDFLLCSTNEYIKEKYNKERYIGSFSACEGSYLLHLFSKYTFNCM